MIKSNFKKSVFDLLWLVVLVAIIIFLFHPKTNGYYVLVNKAHPYLTGFIKFFVLATMGELLALRISGNVWKKPNGIIARAIVWGFIGIAIVLVFEIFSKGVMAALKSSYLPWANSTVSFAFFTSLIMNFTFAPTMMAFHRITDALIDMWCVKRSEFSMRNAVISIDWSKFVSFVVLKTIPFFWVPAHTITFLLPPEYRIVSAALLSIALGTILAFAAKKATI